MLRDLVVSRLGGELWTALREEGKTVELRTERAYLDAPVGRIIKARVTTVLPGIQSAFLDIGTERGGFLHAKDLLLPGETSEPESAPAPIQDRLKVGRELLVQVTRERLRSKGAKVTTVLSLAGRLVVLLPQAKNRGVSRRIVDPEERLRLRGILEALPGETVGFLARTAAAGVGAAELEEDATALMQAWCEIQDKAVSLPAPSVVFPEPGLLIRLLRETPREGLQRIVLDDPRDHRKALAYLSESDPALAAKLSLHAGAVPLFETHGIREEIERALRPKVWLKSGGYLVIEQTEALVSIDVNTGKFIGKGSAEETALRTNLEAVGEIARQLRLRDLGGIIVIDFIDVGESESRRRIVDDLERALRDDPARTKIIGLSELGLLQLTRKRSRPGLDATLTRGCPMCDGRGRIKAPQTVAAEVLSALRKVAADQPGRFVVRVHPDNAAAVAGGLAKEADSSSGVETPHARVEQDRSLRPDGFELERKPTV